MAVGLIHGPYKLEEPVQAGFSAVTTSAQAVAVHCCSRTRCSTQRRSWAPLGGAKRRRRASGSRASGY